MYQILIVKRLLVQLLILLTIIIILSCKEKAVKQQSDISCVNSQIAKKKCKIDTFTVAFYNLENCFDFEADGTEYPEYIPGLSSWTREVQLVKINSMAEVIASLNADIIGICEIEDEDALQDLKEGLKRFRSSYEYHTIGTAVNRTVTCTALLSRFPIRKTLTHHVDPGGNSITREILEVDVEICNQILKIFVNHWPSKLKAESHRIEAAKVLTSRLNSLPSNTEYILLGDFNADYNEFQTFSSFKLNNTGGKTGINHFLKTIIIDMSRIHYVTQDNIMDATDRAHYDLWLELPESKRMSNIYKGNNQTPDHILIPATLLDSMGISYLDNSFNNFTWNSKLLKDGKPFRWQIKWVKKNKIHLGMGFSDHLPVYARFTTHPYDPGVSNVKVEPVLVEIPVLKDKKDMSVFTDGFESSTEGWISCANDITLQRDSSTAAKGKYSLKISGLEKSSNGTVAKTVLKLNNHLKKNSQLSIKGTGKFSFRTRIKEQNWVYFNAPDFKPSKSARYNESNILSWKQIKLDYANVNESDEIDLEIRIGKENSFTLWVDNVN